MSVVCNSLHCGNHHSATRGPIKALPCATVTYHTDIQTAIYLAGGIVILYENLKIASHWGGGGGGIIYVQAYCAILAVGDVVAQYWQWGMWLRNIGIGHKYNHVDKQTADVNSAYSNLSQNKEQLINKTLMTNSTYNNKWFYILIPTKYIFGICSHFSWYHLSHLLHCAILSLPVCGILYMSSRPSLQL